MRPADEPAFNLLDCKDVEQMCLDLLSGPLLEDDDKDLLDSFLDGDLLPLLGGDSVLEFSTRPSITVRPEPQDSGDEEVDVVSVDEEITILPAEATQEVPRVYHTPRCRQKAPRGPPRVSPSVTKRLRAQKPCRTSILIQTPGRGRAACPAATALDHDYCGDSQSSHSGRSGKSRRASSRSSSRSSSSSSSEQSARRRQPPARRPIGGQKEERRVVYVGNIPEGTTRFDLRQRFGRFGAIEEVSVHFRDRGDNYGFVTFVSTQDAYEAVEHGNDNPSQPRFELCFGGRRQFCRTKWADLDSENQIAYNKGHFGPVKRHVDDGDFDSLLRAAKSKAWSRR